jgi:putative salt-induced outer membrane protein YdiY
MRLHLLFSFFFFLLSILRLPAQIDSLRFANGNYIVGEVKSMERGVLIAETDYSDSDFKIEWEGIDELYTQTSFLITLSDGRRFNGYLESIGDDKVRIVIDEGGSIEVDKSEIVYLKSIDDTFASRLSASVDLGFSFTKAQSLRQSNLSARVGYLARRWSTGLSYSLVTSNQDETDPIRRAEGGFSFRYFLPKDWYALGSINTFSSTEQKINLRATTSLGIGKYIIHTNQTYWGVGAGLNLNQEDFAGDAPDRQSLEAYFGTELNLYDVGDFSLFSRAVAYPSFTEGGRWRAEAAIDAKYDLPLDFYFRIGFNLNYDNRPVEGAGETDYVLQSGIGWEW